MTKTEGAKNHPSWQRYCGQVTEVDHHNNAAALIIAAAEKSGLLKEVAEALCFMDKTPSPYGDCCNFGCRACDLKRELAEAFDDHVCLPAIVLEGFHGDGIEVGPFSEAELAPYLNEQNNNNEATEKTNV